MFACPVNIIYFIYKRRLKRHYLCEKMLKIFTVRAVFKLFLISCILLIAACANDSPDDLTNPIQGPITYNATVKKIFDNNCISCHGGIMPEAGLSLETYAGVRAAVESDLVLTRMTSAQNPMPPTGLLPGTTVDIIEEWIAEGYPEN